MNSPFDPLSESSLKMACAARLAGHDTEKSATTMQEMLARGEKQILECQSREGK